MRLKELEVKDFRSIKDIKLTFNGLTGILGGVSVGKSNLLLSLELFWNSDLLAQEHDTASLKKDLYYETIAEIPDPNILNNVLTNGSIYTKYTFEITNIEDLKLFQGTNSPIELKINEINPESIIIELNYDSQTNSIIRRLGFYNKSYSNDVSWLDLPSTEIEFWHELLGRSFIIPLKDELLVDLEEDVYHLLSDHYVKNIFQRYVSQILGEPCEFLSIGDKADEAKHFIYLSRTETESLLPLRYLSKGTKRLLRIISYLVNPKFRINGNILVIDDPEIYLQAREQRALADLLINNVSNNQIIFSTASLRFLVGDLYLAILDKNITSLKKSKIEVR